MAGKIRADDTTHSKGWAVLGVGCLLVGVETGGVRNYMKLKMEIAYT